MYVTVDNAGLTEYQQSVSITTSESVKQSLDSYLTKFSYLCTTGNRDTELATWLQEHFLRRQTRIAPHVRH